MITVQIFTPETQSEYSAEAVFLPGTLGQFEVLKDHAPIISTLTAGTIRLKTASGQPHSLAENLGSGSLNAAGPSAAQASVEGGSEAPSGEITIKIKSGVMRLKNNNMQICCEI